jgi:hypothetical protein
MKEPWAYSIVWSAEQVIFLALCEDQCDYGSKRDGVGQANDEEQAQHIIGSALVFPLPVIGCSYSFRLLKAQYAFQGSRQSAVRKEEWKISKSTCCNRSSHSCVDTLGIKTPNARSTSFI